MERLLSHYQSGSDYVVADEVVDLNVLGEHVRTGIDIEADSLKLLISALFHRRYGWSEHAFIAGSAVAATLEDSFADGELAMRDLPSDALRDVCDAIDGVLKSFYHVPLTVAMIDALEHCVIDSHSPVVRGQALKHFFDWMRSPKSQTDSAVNPVFVKSKALIVRGVTDMWSAIRRRCAVQLSRVVSEWSLEQLEAIWIELHEILSSDSTAWQAQEGAILAMTALMRKFGWAATPGADPSAHRRLEFHGKPVGKYLPEFVRCGLKPALYSLLAHPQLSVRETTSRAFSAFLSRSPFDDLLKCFDEVVLLLKPGSEPLDPYKCEGLLKFSVVLVKLIPVPYLLTRWNVWFDVFDELLSHPASTVRQACSSVFKHVVGRDTSNARLFLLLLMSLARGWSVEKDIDMSWEWKEGRLLTYELILGLLVANHHHYVFPGQRDPRSPHDSKIEVSPRPAQLKTLRGQASVGNLLQSANTCLTASTSPPESNPLPRRSLSRSQSTRDVKAKKSPQPVPSEPQVTQVDDVKLDRRGTIAGTSPAASSLLMRKHLGLPAGMPRRNSLVAMSLVDQLKSLKKTGPSPLSHHEPQPQTPPREIERPSPILVPSTPKSVTFPYEPQTPVPVTPITPSFAIAHAGVDPSPPWTEEWWNSIQLQPSSELLMSVLMQVSSCMLPGSRWELRRMVDQVMPLLIDTALLVNPDILRDLWSVKDPLRQRHQVIMITYSLKHALRRYNRLKKQLARSNTVSGWSEDAIMRALEVIALVESGCLAALPALDSVTRGYSAVEVDDNSVMHVTDRVRVVAAEVLVRICVLFPDEVVIAHDLDPHGTIQSVAYALNSSDDWSGITATLPSVRPFKNASAAEKLLVPSLAPILPLYLQYCAPGDIIVLSRVIGWWAVRYAEDSTTQLHIIESLRIVVMCAKSLMNEESLKTCAETLDALIMDKRVDQAGLALVLRIWLELCEASVDFRVKVLKALVRRLVVENIESVMSSGEACTVEPALHFSDSFSLTVLEDEEEAIGDEDKDERMSEPAPAKDDDDSADEDWDDWDEDNDVQFLCNHPHFYKQTIATLISEFGLFLNLLEEKENIDSIITVLDPHEIRILKWLRGN